MHYLVVGGAGFVGSHTVLALLDQGHEVSVLDNLSTGHRHAVPAQADFYDVDLFDRDKLNTILGLRKWDGVLHFAALSIVGDSMRHPFHYMRYNYDTSLNLIEACVTHDVEKICFSSTAALFGGFERDKPITEDAPILPSSPYGQSKASVERLLHWADRAFGLRSACLRYFNAAGSDLKGRAGEDHRPETHLIPRAIDALLRRQPPLKLFGTDYPTRDGTCIRDYIHVADLAQAHIKALEVLDKQSVAYNLGTGHGFSNLEVIKTIEHVSGETLPWEKSSRREGDPATLVADSQKLQNETGWKPQFGDLETIVRSALHWRMKHPHGYGT